MRTFKHAVGLVFASTTLVAGYGPAIADDPEARTGISVTAAGGVEDFAGDRMRDQTDVNGLWGIHGAYDVQDFVAVEAGYLGSAATVSAPLGDTEATLLGTTVEAIARATPLPDSPVKPYAFVGAAWRHYDVTGEDFTTSDAGMADSDDLFQIPFGAGVGYQYAGWIADARFTFRASTDAELVLEDNSSNDFANMNTWGVTAGIGYEF
jgi:hypothetical protein